MSERKITIPKATARHVIGTECTRRCVLRFTQDAINFLSLDSRSMQRERYSIIYASRSRVDIVRVSSPAPVSRSVGALFFFLLFSGMENKQTP